MKTDHILKKEYLNELFEYKDGNLFWKKAKAGTAKGSLAGTKSHHYYQICINYKIYRTHRLIWIFHNGNTENTIDHINGNSFDNRIENLRICNLSENSCNSRKKKNNTSGVKGVGWCLQKKKWRARIVHKNKEIHIGFFDNLNQAEIKIKEKRQEIHKEFTNNG
jgi:hypothetical protein